MLIPLLLSNYKSNLYIFTVPNMSYVIRGRGEYRAMSVPLMKVENPITFKSKTISLHKALVYDETSKKLRTRTITPRLDAQPIKKPRGTPMR